MDLWYLKQGKGPDDERIKSKHYGQDRWRVSREIGGVVEKSRRIEANLRLYLYPAFADLVIDRITTTTVLEWLTRRLGAETPQSSLRLSFELLDTVTLFHYRPARWT